MNDYKIAYVIENLTTEHIKYVTAESDKQARTMFTEQVDRFLLGSDKIKIISISRVPEPDESCYCNCDSC